MYCEGVVPLRRMYRDETTEVLGRERAVPARQRHDGVVARGHIFVLPRAVFSTVQYTWYLVEIVCKIALAEGGNYTKAVKPLHVRVRHGHTTAAT